MVFALQKPWLIKTLAHIFLIFPPRIEPRRLVAERLLNRELSWLDFNARVLALADDRDVPLLERAKFLAIFSQNLDEFFQVRVAGLKDQVAAGLGARHPRRPQPRPSSCARSATGSRSSSTHAGAHLPRRGRARRWPRPASCFSDWDELDDDDREYLDEVFEERIFPVLTPLAVDPGHPFPYISNLSLNLAVHRARPGTRRAPLRPGQGARPAAPVRGDARRRALRAARAGHRRPPRRALPGHGDRGATTPSGSPATPTSRSRRRRPTTCSPPSRSSCAAAASAGPSASRSTPTIDRRGPRACCSGSSTSSDDDVYALDGPLDLGGLWAVYDLDRPDLKDAAVDAGHASPGSPARRRRAASTSSPRIRERRRARPPPLRLVHRRRSRSSSARRPPTRRCSPSSRRSTARRATARSSTALIRAAERGKQVAALVELKARFDEQAQHRLGPTRWRRRASTSSTAWSG